MSEHIWVIESEMGQGWSAKHGTVRAYRTRRGARKVARSLYLENMYNQPYLKAAAPFKPLRPAVRYRARKFETSTNKERVR